MHDSDENKENASFDDAWDEPHVPTLNGIGAAKAADVGPPSVSDQLSDAQLTPAARERRQKKKLAQQKAIEDRRAFAAAKQKKKKPSVEKSRARGKSEPPPAADDAKASSVRPSAKKHDGDERRALAPSQLRKVEKEERLRNQTKLLFAFAALVLALLAVGFYLH